MSNTTKFNDNVRFERGFLSGIPTAQQSRAGEVAVDGLNAVPSPYGEFVSWAGLSIANQAAAPLLHAVDDKIAGSGSGNVFRQHGAALFFIGSGNVYYDDFVTPIGTATSNLQIYLEGVAYQASLPGPPAPLLLPSTDSAGAILTGQINGSRSAQITRVRTVTNTESPASETSNIVVLANGKIRVQVPASLSAAAQDQWGVYFTKEGRGGIGPHYLFRFIREADIAPRLSLAAAQAAGNGATTIYGGLSSSNTKGRIVGLSLAPSGITAPSYVGASQTITAGAESVLRAAQPQAAAVGDALLVSIAFDAVHQVDPNNDNRGTVKVSSVTGIWTDGGLDPSGSIIEIEQMSTTQFRWRKDFGAWTSGVAISMAPTPLGTTGLAVTWSANTTGNDEVGNKFTITPFSLVTPTGWTLEHYAGTTDNTIGLGVWSFPLNTADASAWDWTSNQATQMACICSAYRGVNLSGIVAARVSNTTSATTTHNVTFGAAPAATDLVTIHFAGEGGIAFTPSAPLTLELDTSTSSRAVDFDFSDGDLTDIISPKRLSGPPAGTHAFPLGPVTVVAGTEDGTGLNPSQANQAELYDLTLTTYLNPAEPLVRVDTRPQDGSIYLFTRNSVQTALFTGSDEVPLLTRGIWPNVGIANPSGACLTPWGLFAAGSRGGFYRSSLAGPDSTFYRSVAHHVRYWNPEETVVGYSPLAGLMGGAFCNRREILFYDERTGLWSVPLDVSEFIYVPGVSVDECRILSHVTLGGALWLSIGNDTTQALHQFGIGPGGNWFLRSAARDARMPAYAKTIRSMQQTLNTDVEHPLTYRLLSGVDDIAGQLVSQSANVGGYGVSDFWMTPNSALYTYAYYYEFELSGPLAKERAIIMAEAAALTRAAAPSLSHSSAGAKFAARVRTDNTLEIWKGGVLQTTGGTVQAGDTIRVGRGPTGQAYIEHFRAGSSLVVYPLGTMGFTTPVSFKLRIVTPGGRLGRGLFRVGVPQMRVKIYRNFNAEKGLPEQYSATYRSSNQTALYEWKQLNIGDCATYNVQVEGTGGGQRSGQHLIEGTISPNKRTFA